MRSERQRTYTLATVAIVAGLVLAFALVVWLPEWLPSERGLSAQQAAEDIGRKRTAVLAMLAGLLASVGALYTARSFGLNRRAHIADRYTAAIEQLGSDALEVRIGGIYALEGVATDAPDTHHGPIMEVFAAYIRYRAPWPANGNPQAPSEPLHAFATDVQSALTALGRRNHEHDDHLAPIRLSHVDLRGASLRGGHFKNARFRESNFEGAHLEGAHLEGTKLRGARLAGADLKPDDDLDLDGAHLEGASLRRAQLRDAKLTGSHLNGALYDDDTTWPPDFDRDKAGCRRVAAKRGHEQPNPPRHTESSEAVERDSRALDYEQTVQMIRTLTDVRFKLLALVPTVSGLGVAVAQGRTRADAIGIGLVGLVATVGVLIYDLRNSQLYGAAMHRAKVLEGRLDMRRSNPADSDHKGGMFSERPSRLRLARVSVWHDRGLAFVYAAAVTGWGYLLCSAAIPAIDDGFGSSALRESVSANATPWALAGAVASGLVTGLLIHVFDHRGDAAKMMRVRWLIHSGEKQVSDTVARAEANNPRPAR